MNGPAHYLKAEELLGQLEQGRGWSAETEISVSPQALAHAALANAAAAAIGEAPAEMRAWMGVAGTRLSDS